MGFNAKMKQINPILGIWSQFDWLLYFLVIPMFLFILYFLPFSVKQYFILQSNNPTVLSIFFNHYIHSEFIYLLNNLVIYLTIIFLLYNLEYNKKRFYLVSTLFFLIIPIIVSLTLLFLIPNIFQMQGFSAINAGFIGYLIYSVYNYLRIKYVYIKLSFFCLIISINFSLLCIINNFDISITMIMNIMVLFFLLIEFSSIKKLFHEFLIKIKEIPKKKLFELYYKVSIVLFTFVMIYSLPILMPFKITEGNMMINTVGHYLGWVFGFILPIFIDFLYPHN